MQKKINIARVAHLGSKGRALLFVLLLFVFNINAQVPNEQDCFGAIPICQDVYSTKQAYSGSGNYPNEIDQFTSCLSAGEKNDVWYTFTVQQSGNLSFLITPNNMIEDYDWAVFNLTNRTCTDIYNISALTVSCNFSVTGGTTGPDGSGLTDRENGGGVPYNKLIPVVQGETYVVNVSNYSASQNGYTIDFSASTAKIFDSTPPSILSIASFLGCGTKLTELAFNFSENILCNTIQSDDFTVSGPDGDHLVTGWYSTQCTAGAKYDKTVKISVTPALTIPGDYYLCLVDADNSVTDLCGNVAAPACFKFTIADLAVTAVSTDVTCNGLNNGAAQITVSNGSGTYSYDWGAGIVTSTNSVFPINGLTPKTYLIKVINGTCSASTSITISEPHLLTSVATATSATCEVFNGTVSAKVSGGVGPYTYIWSNRTISADASNLAPATYTITVSDNNGCTSVSSATVNKLDIETIVTAPFEETIEEGNSVQLREIGGKSYSWLPTEGLSCSNCANPIASPLTTTTYSLTTLDGNGCPIKSTLTINVRQMCIGNEEAVFIPNVFSPNGDGKNDVLFVQGNGLKRIYMSIYNRWGNLVFETADQSNGWDGTYKGSAVEEGTFIYFLKGLCIQSGAEITLKGNVTLIK